MLVDPGSSRNLALLNMKVVVSLDRAVLMHMDVSRRVRRSDEVPT